MSEVVIYSKNDCGGCDLVKTYLENNEVAFTEKNIDKDPAYMEEVQELGVMSFPITVVDGEVKAVGFDIEVLEALK